MKDITRKRKNGSTGCTLSCIVLVLASCAVGAVLMFIFMHHSIQSDQRDMMLRGQMLHKEASALINEIRQDKNTILNSISDIQDAKSSQNVPLSSQLNDKESSQSIINDIKAELRQNTEQNQDFPASKSNSNVRTEVEIDHSNNIFKTVHPTLFLSDEQLGATPVSDMYSWYGGAEGPNNCDGDFGYSLAKRWRDERKEYCSATTTFGSKMDCYLVRQTRHHGNGDNICWMQNVAVDLNVFANDGLTNGVISHYVDTQHMAQPYIPFEKGFISAECQTNDRWKAQSMPGWNKDISYTGFAPNSVVDGTCDTVIEHNVLMIQRDTFANFFHDSEDFTNAFLALAVLEWNLDNTQIYLTDLYPEGPFWPMWQKVFSGKYPALTSWDLRNQHLQGGKKTCFKNLAVGIYGPASPITVASWDTPCKKTALVRGYSDFVIRGLNLQHETRYFTNPTCSRSKVIKLTFLARRSSVEWPEKKFCDDNHSFFKCHFWNSFGIRKLGRTIQNEAELIRGLKALETHSFANGAQMIVKDADFNVLTLEEQIRVDLDTDILVGPHGAGLMHNIFMPDGSALFELFVDGSGANRHFHNLAWWFGRHYDGLSSSNPVNVPSIVESITRYVDSLQFDC